MRQQSKEIATQIRENVREEENRQLDKLNRIKQSELLNWRQKQINLAQNKLEACMAHIGEAHTAAEQENQKQRIIDEQREKNRKLALQRGKAAAEKLNANKIDKTKMSNCKVGKKPIAVTKKIECLPDSDSSVSSISTSSSSGSSVCSAILVKCKRTSDSGLKKTKTNSTESIKPSKVKFATTMKSDHGSTKFISKNDGRISDLSLTQSPLSDSTPKKITKISDQIANSEISFEFKRAPSPSKPLVAKTYQLAKSPNMETKRLSQKMPSRIIATAPSSNISRSAKFSLKSTVKTPINRVQDKKHFVPEFVTSKSAAALSKPISLDQKVVFYDHANRFSKQYDSSIDLIEETREFEPLNAWQEAQRKNQQNLIDGRQRVGLR